MYIYIHTYIFVVWYLLILPTSYCIYINTHKIYVYIYIYIYIDIRYMFICTYLYRCIYKCVYVIMKIMPSWLSPQCLCGKSYIMCPRA